MRFSVNLSKNIQSEFWPHMNRACTNLTSFKNWSDRERIFENIAVEAFSLNHHHILKVLKVIVPGDSISP